MKFSNFYFSEQLNKDESKSLKNIFTHTHVLKNQTDCIGLYHTI